MNLQITNYTRLPDGQELQKKQTGFSMFISIIIVSALTIIAFSVVNISVKESSFSASNRESQNAIFAADAGVECALFWDAKYDRFATSTVGSPISCSGTSISTGQAITGTTTLSRIGGGGDANPTSIFGFSLNSPQNPTLICSVVTVHKKYSGPNLVTSVNSYGYNNCNLGDPRRVERAIEVTY